MDVVVFLVPDSAELLLEEPGEGIFHDGPLLSQTVPLLRESMHDMECFYVPLTTGLSGIRNR
jgi:hypothetical protein